MAAQPPPTPPGSPPRSGNPNGSPSAGTATNGRDPTRELFDQFDLAQQRIAVADPELAQRLQRLSRQGADPKARGDARFRHEVAYAVQDVERLSAGPIIIAPELRSEMTRLAGAAPGLENPRMLALMQATGSIDDKNLVQEIRRAGTEIGRRADQSTSYIESRIAALENQARLTPRSPEAEQPQAPAAAGSGVGATAATNATASAGLPLPANDPRPAAPGANDGGGRGHRTAQGGAAAGGPGQGAAQGQVVLSPGVLGSVLSAMWPRNQGTGAPWDPPPTPMADRLHAFEQRLTESHDQRAFENAMQSGRAALDALQGFANGEGATVMSRIHEAARTNPGGLEGVLAEMRQGGQFADLRQQFNSALQTDTSLAAAYDHAAAALSRYGQDRSTVQDIAARRADASAITQRFEQMDAQIGEVASRTPSRNDGNNMIEDLAQKAAELLQRAVDAVRSVFTRSPGAEAVSQPGASLSPI